MPVFLCLAAAKKELAAHAASLEALMSEYGATAFDRTPTTLCGLFNPGEELPCALVLQSLQVDLAPFGIALHVGAYERLGQRLFGAELTRTHAIARTAWGGQILLTSEYLAAASLPPEATLKPLGMHLLSNLAPPTQLYQLRHPALHNESFPPLRSLSYYPNNLRVQPHTFVGRTQELETLKEILGAPETRLLTLTGPGGIGKTRLALQLAAETAGEFPQGVFFVSCEALPSTALLPSTMEQALQLPMTGRMDPHTHVLNQLRRRAALLVLDNYDSLLPDTAFLTEILVQAPRVKLLATSREPLNLRCEHLYPLGGLQYPHHDVPQEVAAFEMFDAVQFFFLSALHTDPLFTVTEATREALISICELTEGLPLGLELAATAVSAFSCHEIAQKMAQGLEFLKATRREIAPRHHNLRAVFEFTWQQLDAEKQGAFTRCAVFQGPFSETAAQVVADAAPASLQALVRKSMVMPIQPQMYKLHSLLRHFAAEQLRLAPGLKETLEARHSAYFLDYLREQGAMLLGAQQRAALTALAEHLDDIRTAWTWAVEHGNYAGLRAALPAWFSFYFIRGLWQEGAALFASSANTLRQQISRTPLPEALAELALADCLLAEGRLAASMAQNDQAQQRLDEALESYLKYKARQEQAQTYLGLGQVGFNRGQFHLARSFFQQAHELATASGFVIGQRDALHYLGRVTLILGEYQTARQYLNDSLALSTAMGEWWLGMHTIRLRGNVERMMGQDELARDFYLRSLELARDYGSLSAMALALNNLASLAVIASEYPLARRYWEQALAIQRDTDDLRQLANILHSLGLVLIELGEPERGLQLLAEAFEIHEQNANQEGKGVVLIYRGYALEVLERLTEAEQSYREALPLFGGTGNPAGIADACECLGFCLHAQGRYAEAETAFQEALRLRLKLITPGAIATAYRGLGAVAVARGRYDEARQHFQQALQLALSTKWIGTLLHIFVEIAELYAQTEEVNKALELLLAVLRDGRIVVPMQKRIRTRIAALKGALPEEFAAPLPRSGGRLDVEALARTLLAALDSPAFPEREERAKVPTCEGVNVRT